jgi:hypothetical protein
VNANLIGLELIVMNILVIAIYYVKMEHVQVQDQKIVTPASLMLIATQRESVYAMMTLWDQHVNITAETVILYARTVICQDQTGALIVWHIPS